MIRFACALALWASTCSWGAAVARDSVHTSAVNTARSDSSGNPVLNNTRSDSLPVLAPDTAHPDSLRKDTTAKRDTVRRVPWVYRWESPTYGVEECPQDVETALECWRRSPLIANEEIGFPGTRSNALSLTNFQSVSLQSALYPGIEHSQYRSGGVAPPDRYALRLSGGDVIGAEEVWTPVIPLDTPVTRLDWERGALTLNAFQVNLRRMLSTRSYLSLDYYSASADTATYDYQFNLHQPYLSGWGVLGKLYKPIDRDSASLVIDGVSPSIEATHIRPRVGFWLDTTTVLEVFLDRVKNKTEMSLPIGHLDAARPGREDSLQALVPSEFSLLTEGFTLGSGGTRWTSEWSASHGHLDKSEYRGSDSIAVLDALQAEFFSAHGRWTGTGLPGKPSLFAQGISEAWEGSPVLGSNSAPIGTKGWTDAQTIGADLHPEWFFFQGQADAALTRSSRMADQVFWLPQYGAWARADLFWGLSAEAGYSFRREDADWETLYRQNPAMRLYPNPRLQPRTDQGMRGEVAWKLPHVTVSAGIDLLRDEDVWLPQVLPQPRACEDLTDSLYKNLPSMRCTDAGDNAANRTLPDSVALKLRNYDHEDLDAWRLGILLELGHWWLSIDNHFLFNSVVRDVRLNASFPDRQTPERVFKGNVGWKRGLLDGRLKVSVASDWEWVSTRYVWVPNLEGQSKLGKLDEYLVLDFRADMRIKSFLLFFKIMNLNHDRYATEPGVHPPGINFRFGVDWTLWN